MSVSNIQAEPGSEA